MDTKINLCDTCDKHCATCNSNPMFGNGIGNDNVYQCDAYKKKPRIIKINRNKKII